LSDNGLADDFEAFLAAQIAFKANIVAGDERESINKNDTKSRKILNFGHTLAHALERSSNYKLLKHGEAVGYGVIFAALLSKKLGLLDGKVVNLLSDVVHRAGKLPPISRLDPDQVFAAIRHDKKNIDNSVRWVLLKGIGKPSIVPHKEIGDRLVRSTIKEFISSN
jgi:3-dehydroquinate synthase